MRLLVILMMKNGQRKLEMNRDEFLKAVKEDPYQIENADEAFKKDKEIVLAAVKGNGSVLEYVHDSLKKDKEVLTIFLSPMIIKITSPEFAPVLVII